MDYLKSIGEICTSYDRVLVDTCSITGRYTPRNNLLFKEKIDSNLMDVNSYRFWKRSFKKFGGKILFVPEKIKEEIKRGYEGEIPFEEEVNGKNGRKSKKGVKRGILKRYISAIKYSKENCRGLVRIIKNKGAILNFDPLEKDSFEEIYFDNKFLKGQERVLSDQDYDLLISGINLVSNEYKTAIISNDSGIESAWRQFVSENQSFNEFLDFYSKVGENDFHLRSLRR